MGFARVHGEKQCAPPGLLSALGMGQRRGHRRESATELGLRLGRISLGGMDGDVRMCSQYTFFPGWSGLWVPRGNTY